MVTINVDLGSSDRKIDRGCASDGDVVVITSLGSHTLIVDAVHVEIRAISGAKPGAHPTFAVTQGACLSMDHGLLDGGVLSGVTYALSGGANIALDSGLVDVDRPLLRHAMVSFAGDEDANFSYDPATGPGLPPMVFEAFGLPSAHQVVFVGRCDLQFAYDPSNCIGVLRSAPPVGQAVQCRIEDMPQAEADMVAADIADLQLEVAAEPQPVDPTFGMPACLAVGTRVLTPTGDRAVETLKAGDAVVTMDRGVQPLRWVGLRRCAVSDPKTRPIRINAGALGDGAPVRSLIVSPGHRVMLSSGIARSMFGTKEVLIPAWRLLELPGIEIAHDVAEVQYVHLVFDRHELIFAQHAPVESVPATACITGDMSPEQVAELMDVFPEMFELAASAPSTARPVPEGLRQERLVQRHRAYGKMPLAS